ncbi:hypothetical protein P4S07_024040 [Serratia marcescens]|uniref:hypothetical protein n=1 Tax=Serratia marcescens TaxID=615 RepID=UPI002406A49C|nr:hypothetical protein [Serratia marcescens]MDF9722828.1 hypothetical protein [Serratia marcescens]
MKNYEGHETLRDVVAQLANDLYELKTQLDSVTQTYFWRSEGLVDRLAGQVLRDAQQRLDLIHRDINELDHHFID